VTRSPRPEYIVEALWPLVVEIDSIYPDPANLRLHSPRNLRAIKASLAKYKQRKPLVVNVEGRVIEAGSGTWQAAEELGWTHIAAVLVEDDPTTATGFAIADNRTAELATWDEAALYRAMQALHQEGVDADDLGFSPADMAALEQIAARTRGDGDAPPDDPGDKVDEREVLQEKWRTATGQLWLIPSATVPGKAHRLLCGDSTAVESVQRLMGDERAVLFATDPPYLVGYDGLNHPQAWGEEDKNKDWGAVYADVDWEDEEQSKAFYRSFISVAVTHAIAEDAAWYCWHASRRQALLESVWQESGAFVHQQIIWAKDRPVLTRQWYMWQHEPCFFGWRKGHKPKRTADDYPATVWRIPTIAPGKTTLHPTSKPIEVFAIPMRQHTLRGELCYEPFAGSGSQFVAGEQLGRLVYGLDIQPAFVAVTLERLAGMGLLPELLD